jgi:lactoylglutathione lyase
MRQVLMAVTILLSAVPASGHALPSAPHIALDHVGIQASNLDRSVTFYETTLGLRQVPAPFPRDAARWLALGNGRMLHIVANGDSEAPHNRWDHFALSCSNLDAMIAHLDAIHVSWADMDGNRAPQSRPDHVRQIFIQDPDGYIIEINDRAGRH